ncbi:SIR2 family protein [Ruegeria sp. EL01]|uniref:SIR2 family protein n=1 Tax=Ruegeria sp. EL01 TaxID=2107578 RepID=UPI000EA82998|nr:SIR2 family protein [Ruegeria sp. EL01]
MRFHVNGPIIPDVLLERSDTGRVVFLCGAGVSLPSGMPSFIGLTQHVIDFFDPPEDSEIMRAFQSWIDDPTGTNMPLDQIFNLLHLEYGRDEVNALVTERLQASTGSGQVGHHHNLVKRISTSPNGVPQIVTTNFDLLFELDVDLPTFAPPAFPDLTFGNSVEGITYLHGRLANQAADQHPYVLSSADFGRAYLSEAWATNFIRNLLEHYTVVLVGYQAEDPPIKYLLQGLNHDGQFDRTRIYAFDKGTPEDIEAKWRDRGVTAIAYPDHPDLWETMEAWADRADDPRNWRKSVIATTEHDPKSLAPYQRGQVAHVLRSVAGAKLLADAEHTTHPEWVCVFSGSIRSAKRVSGYGDDAEVFEPIEAYGLDDDRPSLSDEDYRRGIFNDDLLSWRHGDENPSGAHRLGRRTPDSHTSVPPRLWHLLRWIGDNVSSPVIAWWAIRQNGLHPRLLNHIEWCLDQKKELPDKARHTWALIIDHHKDPRNREWDGDWFDLKRRVANEGWSPSVLREFGRVAAPKLDIKPPYSLAGARPPTEDWQDIELGHLGQFEVKFLERHNDDLSIPDDVLPQVFGMFEGAMKATSGLLSDIGTTYFDTPTCYPDREVDGEDRHNEAADAMKFFVELFERLVQVSPDIALGHFLTWPIEDQFFFKKLSLYALSKKDLFEPEEVGQRVLVLSQSTFWNIDVAREVIFLLVDRWSAFPEPLRYQLGERLLSGPDQESYWSDDEYPSTRDEFIARYARYLEMQGCELVGDQSERLAAIIHRIQDWSDGWATSTVTENGTHVGWVGTDETPDAVVDLAVDQIIPRAKKDLQRDFGSFTNKRPFTGLVKANPRKALSALSVAARHGDYPQAFWSAMINELPGDITPRLRKVFLHRLMCLPHPVIVELRHTLCRWLEQNISKLVEFDERLAWSVFDNVVDGVFSGGEAANKSGIGEISRGDEVIPKSRRTYHHAINGPEGMCAEAAFRAVPGEEQEQNSLIPAYIKNRIERLFAAPGEGSDHAVSITFSKLNWLMHVDPEWVEQRLVPMLAFDHSAAEPAWNGFLSRGRNPSSKLVVLIKPLLLELPPWIARQAWDRDLAKVAIRWLGWLCIFRRDKEDGLSKKQMRRVLRDMSGDTRNQLIWWLGKVGQGNDNGWEELVVPFLNDVWPRERIFRTASSVESWIGMLDDTGASFPVVYRALKRFLVPVETDRHPFYRFTREVGDDDPITVQFPEETLDLLDTVTPRVLSQPPYELPKILALITEASPELKADRRYLRLIDLVESN